ncbi:MAG: hypothetical protein O3B13_24790 [Planctomycetota bacterium]|nr:hypothetical protein [Planctomycetota bacterium]
MWCSVCQSDVAAEVGADNRRVSCSNCGDLLGGAAGTTSRPGVDSTSAPLTSPETRTEEARQLLDRWAKGHFFDPYGPPKRTGASVASNNSPNPGSGKRSVGEQHLDGDIRIGVTERQSMNSSQAGTDLAEDSNVETIDERRFVGGSLGVDSTSPIQPDVSSTRPVAGSAHSQAESVGTPSRKQLNRDGEPSDSKVPPSAAQVEASAAELDRLTREIMNRVSRITEARESAVEDRKVESDSRQETAAISFEVDDVSGRDLDAMARHPSRPAGLETFAEPINARPESRVRADPPHQSTRAPSRIQQTSSTDSASTGDSVAGGWYANVGQLLAYLGIIALTAGTSGVVVSYFGGPASYAPYGWLVATIGQMLLFLGIVTLISAGMEQTSQELKQTVDRRMEDVVRQLDLIGSRIVRIEEASSDGPRKPHLLSQADHERRRSERHSSQPVGND